jgi:AcrR family transcriptional regulator
MPRSQVSHRQRQAQATREAVARTARRLFAANGYASTSISEISAAADIPVQTIYSAFGNKPAILEEIRRLWITESAVEELHREALATADARESLRLAARWTRRQMELGADVISMYQEASRTDPRIAEMWRHVLLGREAAIRELLVAIAPQRRRGLKPAQALDVYITCTLPEIYRTLVTERGWPPHRYETWLSDLLIREMLETRKVS